jgi:sarcosine oxidase, subunit gamma
MADSAPLQRRPPLPDVAEQGGRGTAAIRLLPSRAQLALRLAPTLVPQVPEAAGFVLDLIINRCQSGSGRTAMRLGPDEWLLCASDPEASAILPAVEAALAGVAHSLVDVSQGYVAFSVTGPGAADTINAGCPLDLWPSVFRAGHATRTLLGKAEIILARPGGAQGFELLCARSFAPYVRDFLLEAARGFGGSPRRV